MIKKLITFLSIIIFSFFGTSYSFAKKIHCKHYKGVYKSWVLNVFFTKNGKMLVKADSKRKGWTSHPGSYKYKRKTIKVFIHSRERVFHLSGDSLTGTPYSFDIGDDFKTSISLSRNKKYKCK